MSWFSRSKAPKPKTDATADPQMPDDIWTKCPTCSSILYTKDLRRTLGVCTNCNYHFRLNSKQRMPVMIDRHSFSEMDKELRSKDPLNFRDVKKYKDRLKAAEKKTGAPDAVTTGSARIKGTPVMIGVFNFQFMGGSMGSVVGEKLTRMIEKGREEKYLSLIHI